MRVINPYLGFGWLRPAYTVFYWGKFIYLKPHGPARIQIWHLNVSQIFFTCPCGKEAMENVLKGEIPSKKIGQLSRPMEDTAIADHIGRVLWRMQPWTLDPIDVCHSFLFLPQLNHWPHPFLHKRDWLVPWKQTRRELFSRWICKNSESVLSGCLARLLGLLTLH